jgi:hypothetical protein
VIEQFAIGFQRCGRLERGRHRVAALMQVEVLIAEGERPARHFRARNPR